MWFVQLLILFAIVSVGPGLFFARRLRIGPPEKLVVSVAASFLLVYAGSFTVFVLRMSPRCQWIITAGGAVMTAAAFRDLRRLLADRQVRRMLGAFAALVSWGLLLLAFVRSYGGGTWGGDWLEHYQRSVFFLGGAPRDFKFIDIFPLPSRPPLMNVVTAHFLATVNSTDFDVFQVVFVLLNALVLLPCCLVARDLMRPSAASTRRLPWMLLLLLAANPMVCQNLTYTWTKLFTMFYVLLALHLYLRGWRKGRREGASIRILPLAASQINRAARTATGRAASQFNGAAPTTAGKEASQINGAAPTAGKAASLICDAASGRRVVGSALVDPSRTLIVLAFVSLCAGILAHYSAGPYALFVGLHYLLFVWWRRRRPVLEAAVIAGVCVAILATWFVWSANAYGAKTTFASNSTITDSAPMSKWENVKNIGKNLLDTAIPTVIRHPSVMRTDEDLNQPTAAGNVRDFAFLCYQVSVPFGLGLMGMVLVGYLLYRTLISPRIATAHRSRVGLLTRNVIAERLFWLAFIPFIYFVGVLVYGGKDRFGVAHICLQGLILLGLSLLAAGWRSIPLPVRWILLPGLLIDFSVGILLHFTLEGREPQGRVGPMGAAGWLSRAAQANRWFKDFLHLPFWGDQFAGNEFALQIAAVILLLLFAWLALRSTAAPSLQAARPARAAQGRRITPGKARRA